MNIHEINFYVFRPIPRPCPGMDLQLSLQGYRKSVINSIMFLYSLPARFGSILKIMFYDALRRGENIWLFYNVLN